MASPIVSMSASAPPLLPFPPPDCETPVNRQLHSVFKTIAAPYSSIHKASGSVRYSAFLATRSPLGSADFPTCSASSIVLDRLSGRHRTSYSLDAAEHSARLTLSCPRMLLPLAKLSDSCGKRGKPQGLMNFFPDDWSRFIRIALMSVFAYAALVVLLRISGKRTLSKMNAFDLVVTVAMGSMLATVILTKDISLVEGLTAFAILIFLQFVVTFLSVRSAAVSRFVKSEPCLLLHNGRFLHRALLSQRVTEDEVRAAVRSQGIADLASVAAVILETDASFSVIASSDNSTGSALAGVAECPSDSH